MNLEQENSLNNTLKNGQNKCPKCGATEIVLNIKTGKLKCEFCRHEFDDNKVMESNTSSLTNVETSAGTSDILEDFESAITFKCSSCGSSVIVDTKESLQARCHWCRSILSVNEQIPNGAVPDLVLPFKIEKKSAEDAITAFVQKRKTFANTNFKKEFLSSNVMGVYLPYMVVDINASSSFKGQGEHETRRYRRGSDEHEETYYDADLYDVTREFDIVIDDLTVESSIDKLDYKSGVKTTNIINAIMPFDIENAVSWNSNYLSGFTSEKRDTNIEDLKPIVEIQSRDIAQFAVNESLKHYDRGVRWDYRKIDIKGQRWKSAYLPIWLYSYQEVKGSKKVLHYVAVNARTKETMGSIPINYGKLIGVCILLEIISLIAMLFIDFDYDAILLLSGVFFFWYTNENYRNKTSRHGFEQETKREVKNLVKYDNKIKEQKELSNAYIKGANNTTISNIDIESIINKKKNSKE